MKKYIYSGLVLSTLLFSCKKEGCTDSSALNYNKAAKKDDGSCTYKAAYTLPTTYSFLDASGNSTVDYAGQTDRLNQLREMVTYMKTATTAQISATQLKDMFANVGGNANGAFSFSSSRQLKDKCFELDRALFEVYFDSISNASQHFASKAVDGSAGTLVTTDNKTYLFNSNGFEYLQLIEKGLMGAVFMNQALNSYFSSTKMNVDNTTNVTGMNYTQMAHHWDEAFGYFGVASNFPTVIPSDFWGKYSNSANAQLSSNNAMMTNFIKGRAAIVNKVYADRDAAILEIKTMWEKIAAQQALNYLSEAVASFGNDNAKFLHVVSEAYAFTMCLRYTPLDTRKMTNSEVDALLAKFGTNFWNLSVSKLNEIKADLDAKY